MTIAVTLLLEVVIEGPLPRALHQSWQEMSHYNTASVLGWILTESCRVIGLCTSTQGVLCDVEASYLISEVTKGIWMRQVAFHWRHQSRLVSSSESFFPYCQVPLKHPMNLPVDCERLDYTQIRSWSWQGYGCNNSQESSCALKRCNILMWAPWTWAGAGGFSALPGDSLIWRPDKLNGSHPSFGLILAAANSWLWLPV